MNRSTVHGFRKQNQTVCAWVAEDAGHGTCSIALSKEARGVDNKLHTTTSSLYMDSDEFQELRKLFRSIEASFEPSEFDYSASGQ